MITLQTPGLDYVGHEDVLPYKTTEKQPIQNHLFDKFLSQESDEGIDRLAMIATWIISRALFLHKSLEVFVVLCSML